MAYFRLTGSISQRAEVMLRAIGGANGYDGVELGDANLLVSEMPADVIAERDIHRSLLG